MIRAATLITLALAHPAGAFELALPVDCNLGETCYIQQFPDHDPGPGATDFTCGTLSYDGHDGTDFALPTRAAMDQGVNVLAAATGIVKGTRDGIADFAPVIPGKECGNGVVIDHGMGWETQYCHLKQGSVTVKPGDTVAQGTPLGQIGQSGMADFPHLHLSVRQDGKKLDPFAPGATTCGPPADDLWTPDLPHQAGGLLAIGIAPDVPKYDAIKAGLPSPDLPTNAPALVVWAYAFGTRAGDAYLITLTGPQGQIFTERVQMEKPQALSFRATGRKRTSAPYPAGPYHAEVRLMRGPTELGRQSLSITLTP